MRLNDMQESYEEDYPTKETLKEAKGTNDAGEFQTLKGYRQDKVLEAVRDTEDDAKLILKELVIRELNQVGKKFVRSLKRINIVPEVHDIDYYLLENYTQGSSLTLNENMNAAGAIAQEYVDLPTVPVEEDINYEFSEDGDDAYFTGGNELVVSEVRSDSGLNEVGDDYVGDYHVYISDDSEVIYMAGEDDADHTHHDVLIPANNQIKVLMGDVEDYSFSGEYSTTKPFVIEKYISINGTRMSVTSGISTVKSNDSTLNISDVYPGTLELVSDSSGNVVGLTGELGARLGLSFSIYVDDSKYEVTSVEIDALDVSTGAFRGLPAESKELLCLVNHLKEDEKFRLMAQYIFPLRKLVANTAIYNDMAFLPSIGEITVRKNQDYEGIFGKFLSAAGFQMDPEGKPGVYLQETVETVDGDEIVTGMEINEDLGKGWASYKKRAAGDPPGVLEFDDWDLVLLKNSKSLIKRMFKSYYYSRDFTFFDLGTDLGPIQMYTQRLKGSMYPSPGKKLLPWWKRNRLTKENPFDIEGAECKITGGNED